MTTTENQRVYLDDLAKRWKMGADQILEMAISGKVGLWLHFSNVFLQKPGKTGGGKKKTSTPQLHDQAEVKPQAEVLTQVLGRTDRMLIGAEFPCLDAKNKAVMVSNSVGEEWGETSMIGLKPNNLFALLDDVVRYERKHEIGPQPAEPDEKRVKSLSSERSIHSKDHPCFALELHAACNCWEALFAQTETPDPAVKKADILAWLQQHHPELSKAAAERIALVVSPTRGGCR
jgi:hypothetical protein